MEDVKYPRPYYSDAIWTQAAKPLGPIAYILKARTTLLKEISERNESVQCFMFIQGLETLPP